MKTALVIVDVQQGLFDQGPWRSETVLQRILDLIAVARKTAVSIVFLQDRRVEPDSRLHSALKTETADVRIEKGFCDSFLETDLDGALRARGIRRLVIAGLQTEYCVDTTCRRAASLGYRVILVSDAHTTFDSEYLTAEQIVAHHNRIFQDFPAAGGSVALMESRQVTFS